ncbi:MAG: HD domain-containing protein [Candidatus Buchananbacteria bacterium]
MNQSLKNKLIKIAQKEYTTDDPSHDFEHILRVLSNAENIAQEEKADMDILIPAVLFHDVVNYPKHSPEAEKASDESARLAKKILEGINDYPKEKIPKVEYAISVCSFSKGIVPTELEAKILQDADGLEATGAISIMRTFSSTGQMKRPFYSIKDPFCKNRKPNPTEYALDLFYERLLIIKERCHTKKAKEIAERRSHFLLEFLKEFELELKGK